MPIFSKILENPRPDNNEEATSGAGELQIHRQSLIKTTLRFYCWNQQGLDVCLTLGLLFSQLLTCKLEKCLPKGVVFSYPVLGTSAASAPLQAHGDACAGCPSTGRDVLVLHPSQGSTPGQHLTPERALREGNSPRARCSAICPSSRDEMEGCPSIDIHNSAGVSQPLISHTTSHCTASSIVHVSNVRSTARPPVVPCAPLYRNYCSLYFSGN